MSPISRAGRATADSYRGRGAAAIEYLAILVFIVMPIALLLPMFLDMIKTYGLRLMAILSLPYP